MAKHLFKKGDPKPPTSGRRPGVRNKIPRELRALVQDVMVDLGQGKDAEERARSYLRGVAHKHPALFISLLRSTIEQHLKVSGSNRELVRVINLSNVDITDPAVRKRLGPTILGGPLPGLERKRDGKG